MKIGRDFLKYSCLCLLSSQAHAAISDRVSSNSKDNDLPLQLQSDDGVLVVNQAAVPITSTRRDDGFLVWWRGSKDDQLHVYSEIVFDLPGLSVALLDMPADFRIELNELVRSVPALHRLLEQNSFKSDGPRPWLTATRNTALAIMGFHMVPDRTTNLIPPDFIYQIGPGGCEDDHRAIEALPRHRGRWAVWLVIHQALSALCGGGGGGGSCTCCCAFREGDDKNEGGVAANCCQGSCNDHDPCTVTDLCGNPAVQGCVCGFCCGTPKNCDDGNVCTNDSCVNGVCQHPTISCSDNQLCTTDGCTNPGGCFNNQKDCNDGNVCTTDTCNSATGECLHPPSCGSNTCCPNGSEYFCCNAAGMACCSNHEHCCDTQAQCCGSGCCPSDEPQCCPDAHCCAADQTCCGTECCNFEESCCDGQCGLKGACCFFESGSCSELTAACCAQQNGTYQGDGTTCTPGDLCKPKCENCHPVISTFYECGHSLGDPWGGLGPCDQSSCHELVMNTASCDSFPHRKGPARCDTFPVVGVEEVRLRVYTLSTPEICTATDEGGMHLWQELYFGCGPACDPLNPPHRVRCDTGPCGGLYFPGADEPRGTKKACGCP